MRNPRRLRGGAATTPLKRAIRAPQGLSATSPIAAALSLGRIVLINVLALMVTAAATVHVVTRAKSLGPGDADEDRLRAFARHLEAHGPGPAEELLPPVRAVGCEAVQVGVVRVVCAEIDVCAVGADDGRVRAGADQQHGAYDEDQAE